MGSNISRINHSLCLNKSILDSSNEKTPTPPKQMNQSVEFSNIQNLLRNNSNRAQKNDINTNESKSSGKSAVLKSKNSFPIVSSPESKALFGPETPLVTFESPVQIDLKKNEGDLDSFLLSETPTLGRKATHQKQGTLNIEVTPRKIPQDLTFNTSIVKDSKNLNQSLEITNSYRGKERSSIPKSSTGVAREFVIQKKNIGRIRSTTVSQPKSNIREVLGQSIEIQKDKEGIRQSVPIGGKFSSIIKKMKERYNEKNPSSQEGFVGNFESLTKKNSNRYSKGTLSERQRCNDILVESIEIKQEIEENGKELRKIANQYSKKHEQVGEMYNNLKHVDFADSNILQILYNYQKKGALLQKREEYSIVAEYNEQCNQRMTQKYKAESEGLKKMFKRLKEKRKALLQSIN